MKQYEKQSNMIISVRKNGCLSKCMPYKLADTSVYEENWVWETFFCSLNFKTLKEWVKACSFVTLLELLK